MGQSHNGKSRENDSQNDDDDGPSAVDKAMLRWNKIRRYAVLIARYFFKALSCCMCIKKFTRNRLQKRANEADAEERERIKAIQKDPELTFWERLVIYPDNPYKKVFDLVIAIAMLLDIIFSCYKLDFFDPGKRSPKKPY